MPGAGRRGTSDESEDLDPAPEPSEMKVLRTVASRIPKKALRSQLPEAGSKGSLGCGTWAWKSGYPRVGSGTGDLGMPVRPDGPPESGVALALA
jgi:hypothetical protein